ncbi:MAG TPA: oxygenase MpaB family protein, partial [Albitalea sp.]|nr:oxygenase MpaB family protein [Albitalea sp.]
MLSEPVAWQLPAPLHRRVEAQVAHLFQPPGRAAEDFSRPAGEAALVAHDSVSWRVFKNPVTLFVGGVAAVVLELAEPRVRSGVWDHTSFRTQPLQRLQRTAAATVTTVYAARSRAEPMIARVRQLHE